jgi:hypothetical protein
MLAARIASPKHKTWPNHKTWPKHKTWPNHKDLILRSALLSLSKDARVSKDGSSDVAWGHPSRRLASHGSSGMRFINDIDLIRTSETLA